MTAFQVSGSKFQVPHGRKTRDARLRTQRGQMLMIALWVMGLVSVAAGSIAVRAVSGSRLGTIMFAATQRKALAQAGVEQGMQLIAQDSRDAPEADTFQESWATCRGPAGVPLCNALAVGSGTVSIGRREGETFTAGVIDEERKLNLNTASADQLSRLVSAAAPETADSSQLAAAIVDWRDDGVTTPACDEAQLGYACHHAPFDSVDELRLVPGMTTDLFTALEPYVTVYGSGAVNLNTAPLLVLEAMGYSGEAIIQAREQTPFTTPPAEYPGSVVISTAFTVPVEAEMPGVSGRLVVRAVIDRAGHILAWQPQ